MRHTGYVARVLFVFFLTYALLHVCVGDDHIKAGALHLDRKVERFTVVLFFLWDLYSCPQLIPTDPICCPTKLRLVVESSSVPKEGCGLFGLKMTRLNQKVLPLAQHPPPLCRVRAAGAPPSQDPK